MTIKPTITVNGPWPTVAAVAAGKTNYTYMFYVYIFKITGFIMDKIILIV
jgi:hypothetical protein